MNESILYVRKSWKAFYGQSIHQGNNISVIKNIYSCSDPPSDSVTSSSHVQTDDTAQLKWVYEHYEHSWIDLSPICYTILINWYLS